MATLDAVPETFLVADVVIVGSGVIGCAIAADLLSSGLRVLVLEAGPRKPTAGEEVLEGESSEQSLPGIERGRRRGYGGTGARWAGQCAPLDEIDLENRSWIAGASWPISATVLDPWYLKAAEMLGISGERFDEHQWIERGVPPVDLSPLRHKFSVFSPHPDIGAKRSSEFAESTTVHILTDATATEVTLTDDHTRVCAVTVRQADGRARRVAASAVVLAAGGIEIPRLLLLSRAQLPAGVGNARGLVGKHLHDHPNGLAAAVKPRDPRRFQDLYAMLYRGRTRAWARMPLPGGVQRSSQLLNATANAVLEHGNGSPVHVLKQIVRARKGVAGNESIGGLIASAARAVPAVPSVAWRRYVRGLSPSQAPKAAWLQVTSEQPPLGPSSVSLGAHRDQFGLPLPDVRWIVGEDERRAQLALVDIVRDAWARAGIADVVPLDHMKDPAAWANHQADAYHHSGTTRMSGSPTSGVVDADSQVHGIHGLYVAGTAVLPTSSHANPTFPALALALRLATKIRSR